jgi:outer membrane protein OmpA-like peptidoglycan-associated protein
MKSKLVILSLMLAGIATVATAQTKSRYYAESAKDNYFISVGVGGQKIVNPNASDNPVTPAFNISVGKLINPVWGVRGMVSGINTKLYSYIDAEGYTDANAGRELDKNYFTVRVDGLFNISNAIAGYNPDRKFEFYGFMGPALQFAKAEVGGDSDLKALINGSVGLGAAYNINKNWALNLEVRGEVSESPFGDYSSTIANGFVGGTFGATYYFGGKKFVKVTNEALLVAANGDIQKYKELLAAEQANLAAVKDELAKEKAKAPVEVVKEVETVVAGPRAIFFTIGKSNIDAKGMVNINLAADIMKANPDVKYVVNGYADKATGSAKTNQKLSEKRAEAVYKALIKAGVSESQVEWKGNGGQDNMFENSRALTRVVLIEKAN